MAMSMTLFIILLNNNQTIIGTYINKKIHKKKATKQFFSCTEMSIKKYKKSNCFKIKLNI